MKNRISSDEIEKTHPIYDRYLNRYLMGEDFAIGGLEVLNPSRYKTSLDFAVPYTETDSEGFTDETKFKWIAHEANSYLFTHEREKTHRYQAREARASHLPIMAPILSAYYDGIQAAAEIKYNGNTVKEGIIDKTVSDFADNPTGAGDTFEEIRSDVAIVGMATGICHSYLHITSSGVDAPSAYHQSISSDRPYLKIVSPSQLYYWETDSYGNYTQVRFKEILPNPGKDGEPIEQIRIVDTNKWSTYIRVDSNIGPGNNSNKWKLNGSYEHGLGMVPFTSFYTNRIRWSNNAPVPFFPDLVDFDRNIYNMFSLLNRIDWNQTFDILAIPAQGLSGSLNISVYEAISYDAKAGVPMYIHPDAATAAGLWTRIKEQIQLVRTLIGHGRGVAELSAEARSGSALKYETAEKHSKMSQLATGLNRWQQKVFDIVGYATNTKPVEITYPTQFDVMALENKIQALLSLRNAQINNMSIAPVAKQIINELMKRVGSSSDEIKKALDEIVKLPFEKEAIPQVNPLGNNNPKVNPLAAGDSNNNAKA